MSMVFKFIPWWVIISINEYENT